MHKPIEVYMILYNKSQMHLDAWYKYTDYAIMVSIYINLTIYTFIEFEHFKQNICIISIFTNITL